MSSIQKVSQDVVPQDTQQDGRRFETTAGQDGSLSCYEGENYQKYGCYDLWIYDT